MNLPPLHTKAIAIVFALLILTGLAYLALALQSSNNNQPSPSVTIPPAGPISIRGVVTCLPHIETEGPQTLECAFGFKDNENRYFALRDTDPSYSIITSAPMNEQVEITGVFTPQTNDRYQDIGIIVVSRIEPIQDYAPVSATLTGIYLCLPHTDTTGPQTEECAIGIKTDDGIYYALNFTLSSQTIPEFKSGDRITASGVITPIERLSTNQWQKYPVSGIFSVTDSARKP